MQSCSPAHGRARWRWRVRHGSIVLRVPPRWRSLWPQRRLRLLGILFRSAVRGRARLPVYGHEPLHTRRPAAIPGPRDTAETSISVGALRCRCRWCDRVTRVQARWSPEQSGLEMAAAMQRCGAVRCDVRVCVCQEGYRRRQGKGVNGAAW